MKIHVKQDAVRIILNVVQKNKYRKKFLFVVYLN